MAKPGIGVHKPSLRSAIGCVRRTVTPAQRKGDEGRSALTAGDARQGHHPGGADGHARRAGVGPSRILDRKCFASRSMKLRTLARKVLAMGGNGIDRVIGSAKRPNGTRRPDLISSATRKVGASARPCP